MKKTFEKKIKKQLTKVKVCDRLIELSRTASGTLKTKQNRQRQKKSNSS